MSRVRALAFDPRREVREAAYRAELAGYEAAAVPIAAALNGIKGESITLNRRRGWDDPLDPALALNSVDRPILEAMQSAVQASLPDFRRYLHAKAALLGHPDGSGLPWFDLFAPVSAPVSADGDRRGANANEPRRWTWDEATSGVESRFRSYSDRLADMARRAVDERWIDAEPRDGKGSGAFCMSLEGDRSLVLVNFAGSFRDVQTLAHELGHAYHNVNLADRTPFQRQTPMALAETASIFCETLLVEQGLAATSGAERLALLEGDLQSSCQIVVDIHSRFLFEASVYEARKRRPLSVAEFNDLMLDAQLNAYGDGLSAEVRHPYMWAVKPHYYGMAFYNWPYTFGLLFGIGLFARYREDPESFRAGYDDLLSATGLGSASDLGARFGIDVTDTGFWSASLDVLRTRIDDFVALAGGTGD